MSLSLAEKQKLQKEQEFQQRLKTQQPIHAKQASPKSGGSSNAQSKPTDLTHTLLDSTPAPSLSSSGSSGLGGMSSGGGGGLGGMSSSLSSKPMLNSGSTMGMPYGGGSSSMMNNQTMYSGSTMGYGGTSGGLSNTKPQAANQPNSSAKSNTDTSAFDTLLGPQFGPKSKPSLSQMSQGGGQKQPPGMMGMQQGMMGMNPNPPMGMQQQQQSTMGMYPSGGMGMGMGGMMGNWQTQGTNQLGGGAGGGGSQMSTGFDPLAPMQQSKPQMKSGSLLDL